MKALFTVVEKFWRKKRSLQHGQSNSFVYIRQTAVQGQGKTPWPLTAFSMSTYAHMANGSVTVSLVYDVSICSGAVFLSLLMALIDQM